MTTITPTAERKAVMASAGYSFPEGASGDDALELAGLNWMVEKVAIPQAYTSTGVPIIGSERMQMIARQDTGKMLGVPGSGYQMLQNEELADLAKSLLDNGDAALDSGGSWRGDRMVWLAFRINGQIDLGGLDPTQTLLYLISSHDGKSSGVQAMLSTLRLFCTNQVPMLLRGAKGIDRHISFKHTANMAAKIEDAKRALRLGYQYQEAYQAQAEELLATRMNQDEFGRFMDRLVPLTPKLQENPESRAALNRQDTIDAIKSLWLTSDNLDNVRGTRWAAFNAVAEYEDWGRRQRTSNTGDTAAQARHFRAVWDNPVKDRALDLLTA